MSSLTKAQLKVLTDLGLTSTDVEKAQAKQAREAKVDAVADVFAKHAANLAAFVADLAEVAPISGSTKEGSSWVGTSGSGEISGLGVKVVITDKAASEARRVASKNA